VCVSTFKTDFSPQTHFFGYEGRCAFPSNFDAQYCYALGYNALVLIANNLTGYLSSIQNLTAPISEWKPFGIPLTMMMNIEKRHGEDKPVIRKALVESQGKAFKYFEKQREKWSIQTMFRYPGSIQYYGHDDVANATTLTIQKERPYKIQVKTSNINLILSFFSRSFASLDIIGASF
jgi:pyrophosphate--fructose-6-phosphate 1-phosphotransferase